MTNPKTSVLTFLVGNLGSHLVMISGTFFFSVLALCAFWVPQRGNVIFHFAQWWGRYIMWGSGIRPTISHRAEYAPNSRFILMSNHQGMYDIPALLGTVPFQTRFMAKRSLFRIPLFGWAMSLGGFVPVDRGDKKRGRRAFGSAIETLGDGVSVLVFPEETRSPDGKLLRFRRGGFLIALKSGLPILPVGISGTHAARPKGTWSTRPGPISISFGDPIDVADYGLKGRRELEAEVRRQILDLSGVEDSTEPAVDKVEAVKGE